jgi:hypothetical protein
MNRDELDGFIIFAVIMLLVVVGCFWYLSVTDRALQTQYSGQRLQTQTRQ